jgi:hypothetical protein
METADAHLPVVDRVPASTLMQSSTMAIGVMNKALIPSSPMACRQAWMQVGSKAALIESLGLEQQQAHQIARIISR